MAGLLVGLIGVLIAVAASIGAITLAFFAAAVAAAVAGIAAVSALGLLTVPVFSLPLSSARRDGVKASSSEAIVVVGYLGSTSEVVKHRLLRIPSPGPRAVRAESGPLRCLRPASIPRMR